MTHLLLSFHNGLVEYTAQTIKRLQKKEIKSNQHPYLANLLLRTIPFNQLKVFAKDWGFKHDTSTSLYQRWFCGTYPPNR